MITKEVGWEWPEGSGAWRPLIHENRDGFWGSG